MGNKILNIKYIPAKSGNNESEYLPLVWHLIDTEYTIMHLLNNWAPENYHQKIGMEKAELEKFCKFIALTHDLGKATPSFLDRIIHNIPDLKYKLEKIGLFPVSSDIRHERASEILLVNFLREDSGISEDDWDLIVRPSVAGIIGSHHGKPTDKEKYYEELSAHKEKYGWNTDSWKNIQAEIIAIALKRSGYKSLADIPEVTEAAQMILSGLLIMADWIASNQNVFSLIDINNIPDQYDETRITSAIKNIDIITSIYHIGDSWKQEGFFTDRFGFKIPNQIQKAAIEIAASVKNPGIMIIEAPMGSGKTEAAFAATEILMNRFCINGIGLFLPTQATSDAMFRRFISWAEKQPDIKHATTQLIHANRNMNEDFLNIRKKSSVRNKENSLIVNEFFCGKKTGLLADLTIGTIDQLLMAALRQKHIMLRHMGLIGKVVVIDECHAYDAYMSVYLDRILQWLGTYQVPVILLSATLPKKRKIEMISAYTGVKNKRIISEHIKEGCYPAISWSDNKEIHFKEIQVKENTTCILPKKSTDKEIIENVKKVISAGGCVGLIFNTVRRVQNAAEILQKEFPECEILIDHSQFVLQDRLAHEKAILECVGKDSTPEQRKGIIVIGTQVLEQSLDLDFDFMITDLCPMDLLMQRIGRLHRHKRSRPDKLKEAVCVVLNCDPDNLEQGSVSIYGEYLLKRTIDLLPQMITLPGDIHALTQKTYDEIKEEDQVYKKEYEDYDKRIKDKENKAAAYRIAAAKTVKNSSKDHSGLHKIFKGDVIENDTEAQKSVRDGISSIEVIVLKRIDERSAQIMSGDKVGTVICTDETPSDDVAREVAKERLRLPSYFSKEHNIESVIKELERDTNQSTQGWDRNPYLRGELILFLDHENCATLYNKKLCYSEKTGLMFSNS